LQVPHLDSKTRGFPPHPHGWFGFSVTPIVTEKGCVYKERLSFFAAFDQMEKRK